MVLLFDAPNSLPFELGFWSWSLVRYQRALENLRRDLSVGVLFNNESHRGIIEVVLNSVLFRCTQSVFRVLSFFLSFLLS